MSDDKEKIIKLQQKSDKKKGVSDAMSRAFMEDENIRKASQDRSIEYINRHVARKGLPGWLWFVTGILFTVTLENVILNTPIIDWLLKFF